VGTQKEIFMDAQPQEQPFLVPMRAPTTPISLEPKTPTGVEPESEEELDRKIPEPDFESFKEKTIGELEVEIEYLEPRRLRTYADVGNRVYWLNHHYVAKYKRKGTGHIETFCNRLGWKRHQWSYLVQQFTPPNIKEEKEAKKKARAKEKEAKKLL